MQRTISGLREQYWYQDLSGGAIEVVATKANNKVEPSIVQVLEACRGDFVILMPGERAQWRVFAGRNPDNASRLTGITFIGLIFETRPEALAYLQKMQGQAVTQPSLAGALRSKVVVVDDDLIANCLDGTCEVYHSPGS